MQSLPSASVLADVIAQDGDQYRVRELPSAVPIRRVIRYMRGGSQSKLVQCEDGRFYVAKFMGNPQGNRTLINELIAYRFMADLGVTIPAVRLLELPDPVRKSADIFFLMGNKRVQPEQGWHLGSECPVNPEKTAIFDFLPAKLLERISNISEFALTFVLDRWLYNTDRRQTIYVRDRKTKGSLGFRAYFIDQGMVLGGSRWELGDAPQHGLALPRSIYSMIEMRMLTSRAVEAIQAIPHATLQAASEDVPAEWFGPGDRECLATLLGGLVRRQVSLPALVSRHLDALSL